jgi:hypothetical protein
MPALVDMSYEHQGSSGKSVRCRLRLYCLESRMIVAVVSELSVNPGASMTHDAEDLATQVRAQFLERGQGLLWIEHDPGLGRDLAEETFAWVAFRWDGQRYDHPIRHPSNRREVERAIGEALE